MGIVFSYSPSSELCSGASTHFLLNWRPVAIGEVPRFTIDATHDLSFDIARAARGASAAVSCRPGPFEDLRGALPRPAHGAHLGQRLAVGLLGFDFRRDVRHDLGKFVCSVSRISPNYAIR
jgi:hypothetical protein